MSATRSHPRRSFALLLTALALAALGLVVPARASAAPSCAVTWGSLARTSSGGSGSLTDVRAGRHDCYDRLVLDVSGDPSFSSWNVRYVDRVTEDASGRPVPLRGGAHLVVTLSAPDSTPDGRTTYAPANRRELVDVTGFRTFRQVAWAGSFEGTSQIGLGLRARLPFRVFALPGTPGSTAGRVVVDVAHAW